ncbi:hypothetical protein PsorP6_003383 [Peronosclerospora sorghi]|uniref:Uncharacterized protein n=1 Tax=Peronosclerospora sorghi TaxID=230839 RepID=A0ACC0VL08_9STRA|nr:hypothetical protein PsorP6_003383 [Peronosclerospora sorghi]
MGLHMNRRFERQTPYTGWCDKEGCSFKPYLLGPKTFIGRGKFFDIDTTRPFTVITQFVTRDNTSTGKMEFY